MSFMINILSIYVDMQCDVSQQKNTVQNEKQKHQPYSSFERSFSFCIRAFPFENNVLPRPLTNFEKVNLFCTRTFLSFRTPLYAHSA